MFKQTEGKKKKTKTKPDTERKTKREIALLSSIVSVIVILSIMGCNVSAVRALQAYFVSASLYLSICFCVLEGGVEVL